MAGTKKPKTAPMKLQTMSQADVPKGREGKHIDVISQLLNEISRLERGKALKVPLSELPDTKENIRSALNRATREKGLSVATSSDSDYWYVWKP